MSETDKIFIHTMSFDKFLEFIEACTLVNAFTVYTMPSKAESYADVEKVTELISTLNEYNASEEWRMDVSKNLPIKVNKQTKELYVGKNVIKDALQVIIVAPLNMAFIVPGPESKNFKPCEIIQFNNFLRQQPMVYTFNDVEEDAKHKLVGQFVPISES